jgi:hypothetical protein
LKEIQDQVAYQPEQAIATRGTWAIHQPLAVTLAFLIGVTIRNPAELGGATVALASTVVTTAILLVWLRLGKAAVDKSGRLSISYPAVHRHVDLAALASVRVRPKSLRRARNQWKVKLRDAAGGKATIYPLIWHNPDLLLRAVARSVEQQDHAITNSERSVLWHLAGYDPTILGLVEAGPIAQTSATRGSKGPRRVSTLSVLVVLIVASGLWVGDIRVFSSDDPCAAADRLLVEAERLPEATTSQPDFGSPRVFLSTPPPGFQHLWHAVIDLEDAVSYKAKREARWYDRLSNFGFKRGYTSEWSNTEDFLTLEIFELDSHESALELLRWDARSFECHYAHEVFSVDGVHGTIGFQTRREGSFTDDSVSFVRGSRRYEIHTRNGTDQPPSRSIIEDAVRDIAANT